MSDDDSESAAALKPGQKFPTPTPGNGDRVFYETLLHQRPDSIMAQEWCVVYGVLEGKEAVKAHQQMLKRKGKSVSGGSASASSPKKEKAKKKSKKSSRILDDNVEFDAGMDAGGDEGIGMATL